MNHYFWIVLFLLISIILYLMLFFPFWLIIIQFCSLWFLVIILQSFGSFWTKILKRIPNFHTVYFTNGILSSKGVLKLINRIKLLEKNRGIRAKLMKKWKTKWNQALSLSIVLSSALLIVWTHLDSSGLIWPHLDSFGLNWTHTDSFGHSWMHCESHIIWSCWLTLTHSSLL